MIGMRLILLKTDFMTIEIHSPGVQVEKSLVKKIETKLVKLSHISEKISRSEVYLTREKVLSKKDKACKIRLDIFGDTLFVHKHAETFEKAAMDAIKVLKKLLKQKAELHNEPEPDILTTVKP